MLLTWQVRQFEFTTWTMAPSRWYTMSERTSRLQSGDGGATCASLPSMTTAWAPWYTGVKAVSQILTWLPKKQSCQRCWLSGQVAGADV